MGIHRERRKYATVSVSLISSFGFSVLTLFTPKLKKTAERKIESRKTEEKSKKEEREIEINATRAGESEREERRTEERRRRGGGGGGGGRGGRWMRNSIGRGHRWKKRERKMPIGRRRSF